MNSIPSFLAPLLSNLESIYKQANEYKNSNLTEDQLLTKISHDIGEITNPVKEILEASDHFRSLFKAAALKEGYSEVYIQGVFDTAEKLCKQAAEVGPLLEPLEGAAEKGLSGILSRIVGSHPGGVPNVTSYTHYPEYAKNLGRMGADPKVIGQQLQERAAVDPALAPQQEEQLFKQPVSTARPPMLPAKPVTGSTPNSSYPVDPAEVLHTPQVDPAIKDYLNVNKGKSSVNSPPYSTTPSPAAPAPPENTRSFLHRMMFKSPNPGRNVMTGAGIGGAVDLMTGMPGVGTAAGALGGLAKSIGPARLAAGGAALYGGSKLLGASGAPQGAGQGISDNVSGADLPMSDPRSQQNDMIPGVSNGWTGTIGGGLAAALLANKYGLTGIPGMAATLLGAYGGHQFLPQILSKMKSGGGMGGMFQSPGYTPQGQGIQPNNVITPDSIARGIGENQYANGGQ